MKDDTNTKKKSVFWTMKNGKKINVDDMEIQHLRNVLKMIIPRIGDINFMNDDRDYMGTEIDIY